MSRLHPQAVGVLCGILFCWGGGRLAVGETWRVEVSAGDHDREDCPVVVRIPEGINSDRALHLRVTGSDVSLPIQRDGDGRFLFLLEAPLSKGTTRRYELSRGTKEPMVPPRAVARPDGDLIRVEAQGRPVLSYHVGVAEPPSGTNPLYRRSGHIHPVLTPGGRLVTDEFPADHLHQHALFSAWVRTRFEGRQVDFWNQLGGTGAVRHGTIRHVVSGPVFAEFQAELEHVDLSAPDGPRVALRETWTVRVYATQSGHLFDIESRQQTAGESRLLIEEYHYGGMAARGAAEWTAKSGADFLTSEGKTRSEGNHTRPNWVALHGPVAGEACGFAVFCSPENFRSPQPVRLHPSMPYFVFSPCVLGEFAIEPGQVYVSRYRYFVFDGLPDVSRLNAVWQDFAEPMKCLADPTEN